MKVGLYFGTFNPIHVGHLTIANHIAEYTDLEQVWLVVTPHNPLKKKQGLLDNYQRLEMVYRATKDYNKLKPSQIEFKLPQPNYTINTLVYLHEKHPENQFALIMGEDNLKSLHKWKNYDIILNNYLIYMYPRYTPNADFNNNIQQHKNIRFVKAPIMELSSTHIRNGIKNGKIVRPMLPESVWNYIDEMNFYK